jgi:hypothetical protein
VWVCVWCGVYVVCMNVSGVVCVCWVCFIVWCVFVVAVGVCACVCGVGVCVVWVCVG